MNDREVYRPTGTKKKEGPGFLSELLKGLLPFSLIGLIFCILFFLDNRGDEFTIAALYSAPVIVLIVSMAILYDRFIEPKLSPLKDIVNRAGSRRPEPEIDDSGLSDYAADRVRLMERELRYMLDNNILFVIFGSDGGVFVQFANCGDGVMLDLPANQLDGDMRRRYEEIAPKKHKSDSFGDYSYQRSYDRDCIGKAARFAERIFSEVFELPDDHKVYLQRGERMK